ncbi:MAG: alpha-amylase [Prevotella sp.]|nr:alpha-amylase [Prevotella sp.]
MKQEKIIIYQILTRLFGNKNQTNQENGSLEVNGCGKMNDLDDHTLRLIKGMGITHIWYTGIIRHASQTDYSRFGIPTQHGDVVKGKAGSPYAITDYYDIDPDLAENVDNRMKEFEALVERTHQAGMKVIMDFVPNHVAREYKSIYKPADVSDLGEADDVNMHFSTRNNFYYCWGQPLDLEAIAQHSSYHEMPARATGNDLFGNRPSRNDWYETVKLNYGIDYCDAGGRSEHFNPIPDTWNKMTDILLFWAKKGVDGFRCDMAEMVPAAFWAWATDKVKYRYPDMIFIGEVYNPAEYRNYIHAGFDYLYDKVGMYDCIRDVICGHRQARDITYQWQSTDDIRNHMLYFLENHDEQRIASDFFAGNAQSGFPAHLISVLLQKNPYMLYAGQEFGEKGMDKEGFSGGDGRTTIFDYWCVDTLRRGYFDRRRLKQEERKLMSDYQKVMLMANAEKAFREGEMFDLMYANDELADRQYAFLRKAESELILVVANFSASQASVRVRIPRHAFDFLGILEKETDATDLLTGNHASLPLYADVPFSINIPAHGGRVFKMIL